MRDEFTAVARSVSADARLAEHNRLPRGYECLRRARSQPVPRAGVADAPAKQDSAGRQEGNLIVSIFR